MKLLKAAIVALLCAGTRETVWVDGQATATAAGKSQEEHLPSPALPIPLGTNAIAVIEARILSTMGSVHKQVKLADVKVIQGSVSTNKDLYVYFTQTFYTLTNRPAARYRFFLSEKAGENETSQYWWLLADRYDHDGMILVR